MLNGAVFLVGPTASGKTDVAFDLARRLNGEIISCDSMQVYRGMDIGTAKPSANEQRMIRHHLINMLSPRTECSVYKHSQLAVAATRKIIRKGKTPILVGGSGLYLKAITDGIPDQPGKRFSVRKKLQDEVKKKGLESTYAKLKRLDPERAKILHPHDERRIIRALEIWTLSRRRPSANVENTRGLSSFGIPILVIGLDRDREKLYERIEKRVDQMFANGWIEEVKRLRRKGLSQTARAAIGYREILEFLQDKRSFLDTVTEIKKRTRHLAKKQMTWFRRDPRVHWISISGDRFLEPCVREIVRQMKLG